MVGGEDLGAQPEVIRGIIAGAGEDIIAGRGGQARERAAERGAAQFRAAAAAKGLWPERLGDALRQIARQGARHRGQVMDHRHEARVDAVFPARQSQRPSSGRPHLSATAC